MPNIEPYHKCNKPCLRSCRLCSVHKIGKFRKVRSPGDCVYGTKLALNHRPAKKPERVLAKSLIVSGICASRSIGVQGLGSDIPTSKTHPIDHKSLKHNQNKVFMPRIRMNSGSNIRNIKHDTDNTSPSHVSGGLPPKHVSKCARVVESHVYLRSYLRKTVNFPTWPCDHGLNRSAPGQSLCWG